MKGTMGHDLRTRLLVKTHGTAEMIGMGMRNEDGMDMPRLETGLSQAMQDGIPRGDPGEARVDQGSAVVVDQGVHVHMAQSGNADRQLHTKNILRDFRDLFLGVFLFLSFRFAHDLRL